MICPKCKAECSYKESAFCQECGAFLHNECTNENCELNDFSNIIDDEKLEAINVNDKFCYLCGEKTKFYNEGHSSAIICPKCNTEIHHDEPLYCHECGTFLINYCSNPDCELNCQYDEKYSLPSNDKYCYVCGEKTTFNLEGYFDNDK